MSCKYNNCKICGYKSECEIYKENAELKEINTHTLSRLNLDNGELIIQLTKAKEIIKKYLAIGVGGKITQNYLDVTKEAEQFLNSEAVN